MRDSIDWITLTIYMAILLWVGVWTSRKQKSGDESYFLAGRTMPSWAVAMSVLATAFSAATFTGVPQMAFDGNISYLVMNIGGIVAAFIVAFFFVPPLYRAGTITIYGCLKNRFGPSTVTSSSCLFLFGRLLASGARLYIAAIPLAYMLFEKTDNSMLIAAIVLASVLCSLFTVMGGIKAVIWTDVIQLCVTVGAAILSLVLLYRAIPAPFGVIIDALRTAPKGDKLLLLDFRLDPALPYTFWTGLFAATLLNVAVFGTDQDMIQRVLTARSIWGGGKAMLMSTFAGIPVVMIFMAIGLLLHIFYQRPDLMGACAPGDVITDSRNVFPFFLMNELPRGVRGLAMAGLVAVVLGSLSSAMNALASALIGDLYIPWRQRRGLSLDQGGDLFISRLAVAGMGVALMLIAIACVFIRGNQHLIDFALGVMAFANAPMLGVFCVALFTRRGTAFSANLALLTGFICVLLLQPYTLQAWLDFKLSWPWTFVIASPLSFLVCVIPSRGELDHA